MRRRPPWAAVLASRRPAHPVGWLLCGLGLSLSVAGVVYAYVRYGLVARPGALPAAGYLAGLSNGMILIWLSCVGFVLLLTPTGSLPSPRWPVVGQGRGGRAGGVGAGVGVDPAPMRPEYPAIGNPLGVPALRGVLLGAATGAAAVVVLAALIVGAGSLVGRFRRARGVERQQLRWLALAAALAVAEVFQPARRRVQAAVDRRFNRRRYDAAQAMQPTQASVWLRPSHAASGAPTRSPRV